MMWPWRRRRANAEHAAALLEGVRRELLKIRHEAERLRLELALVKQARDRADADVRYWRDRAEKFIDQIGMKYGTLSVPTMTAAPPDETKGSHFDTVFAALGTSEINRDKNPPAGAAHAAPTVVGVDAAVAQAAVDELLQRT
jgi:hypothetical protein